MFSVLCGRMSDKGFDCDRKGDKVAVDSRDILRYMLSLLIIQTVLHCFPFHLEAKINFLTCPLRKCKSLGICKAEVSVYHYFWCMCLIDPECFEEKNCSVKMCQPE